MKAFFSAFLVCLSGFVMTAQKNIVVLDAKSHLPVPFVNVCIEKNEKKNYQLTRNDGTFEIMGEFPFTIAISGIGYQTHMDTIRNSADTIVYLNPAVFDLDEVIVTGQATAKKTDQSIYKVNVINRQEIEQKAAINLTNLLNNELNINISQNGVLGRNLSIRGLSGEHIKILIDGVPVVGRQLGMIDLDQINLNNVDHIEIIEGPLSVMYGSNALGGVINIITKQPTGTRFSAGLNTYYESVGIYNADADFTFGKKNNYRFYGARNFWSGFDPEEDSRFQLWKPKLQYNTGLKWSLSEKKLKLSSSVDFLHEELRDKDSIVTEWVTDRYYFTKRMNSSLHAEYSFNKLSKLFLTGGYSFYQKIKNTYSVNMVSLSKSMAENVLLHDTALFNLFYQRGYYSLNREKLEVLTGYDMNYENGSGKRISGKKEIGDFAVFANVLWTPVSFLQIQPGIRMAYNTKYNSPLVYSVNFLSKPGHFTFRASYGKGFRTPSLKELYLQFVDQNHNVHGNENLKAETSENYTITANYLFSTGKNHFELSADLFYNHITNKIDFLFDANDPAWAQYFNISDYKTKGAEFEIKYQFHPRFTFRTGTAFNGISTITGTDRFFYNNDYTASFHYKNLKYLFQLSAFFKYTGKKTFYQGSFDVNDGSQEIEEKYINGYKNLDVTFSVPVLKNRIQITAGAKNLFNTINIYSTGSQSVHGGGEGFIPSGWGRTWFIKLGYRFFKY